MSQINYISFYLNLKREKYKFYQMLWGKKKQQNL